MASVFDQQKISYALEKIGDFIRRSGTGAQLPDWAETGSKVIIDNLQAFEEKQRRHNVPLDEREHEIGMAIYAACELQAFMAGDKSDIANRNAAIVYRDFLAAKIDKLRRLELALEES